MKAVAVFPDEREVKVIERREPDIRAQDQAKLRMLEVGVCGTDRELCAFVFGTPPPGFDHFILGHESLAEIVEVGREVRGFAAGDLVVAGVRLPCADEECGACRSGHQDFCSTGNHREHGIKDLDGFMTEFVVEDHRNLFSIPKELRNVAVLLEPLSIAEKALKEAERIETRLPWRRTARRALVLGAGPVGLLGAMKLVESGFETFVYSQEPEPNPGAAIVAAIGATYLSTQSASVERMRERVGHIDLVYEALGAAQIAFYVLPLMAANGTYVFTGVPRDEQLLPFETRRVIANLVLTNQAIVGSVNAGRQAFLDGIDDLVTFQRRWPVALNSLITARYRLEEFRVPLLRANGIKNVIQVAC